MKNLILYIVEEKTKESKWIKLPTKEIVKLESLLGGQKRFLIHKFKTNLPNLKIRMKEDILDLNNLLLGFSESPIDLKDTVLGLCENGLEFIKSIDESKNYKLLRDINNYSDYGLFVLKNEVRMSNRMISSMNLEEYAKNILANKNGVFFSSYGLLIDKQ